MQTVASGKTSPLPFRSWRWERYWLPVVIVVPVFLIYALGLGYPLVFDDLNAQVFDPRKLQQIYSDHYVGVVRWPSSLSFVWTIKVFGFFLPLLRFQNVVAHCANVLLLYLLLQAVFDAVLGKMEATRSRHRWWAAIGALWFGLNPVAVYATAYLIQRSMLMATGFSLISAYCLLRMFVADHTNRRAWGLMSSAAYLLAFLSKEHAILLPAVMMTMTRLILPGQVHRAQWRRILVPIFSGVAVLAVVRWDVLVRPYEGHAIAMLSMQEITLGRHLIDVAYPLSVITQCGLFFKYLVLWLLPLPQWMSIDMHPPFFLSVWGMAQLVSVLGYLAWGIAGWRLLVRGGAVGLSGFAMLWPWLLFLTELSTARFQEVFVLYRSYLWMAGLPFLLPLLLRNISSRFIRILIPAILIGLLPLVRDRHATFSSNMNLWSDALEKNDLRPNVLNGRAWMYRGIARMRAGDLEGSGVDLEQAVKLDPWFAEPYGNRAVIALRQGRLGDALRDCNYALEIDPGLEVFRKNRDLIVDLMKKKNAR